MTIKELCDTITSYTYHQIIVRWKYKDDDSDYAEFSSMHPDAIIDLVGDIKLMTMEECGSYDASDGSVFLETCDDNRINVIIYIDREQIEERQKILLERTGANKWG